MGYTSKNKLLVIEGIRGIACFMVVLSHLSLTFFPYLHNFDALDSSGFEVQNFLRNSPFAFFISGTSAVYIFFVLSGYILTTVASNNKQPLPRILSMSLKRYPRLMIPALFSCLIAYLLFRFVNAYNDNLGDWIKRYGDFNYSFLGAIHSGAVDAFFLSGQSLYNPVLWTMQIELIGSLVIYILCANQFYIKIPLLPFITFSVLIMLTLTKIFSLKFGLGIASFYGGYLFRWQGFNISTRSSILLLAAGLYLSGAHIGSLSYTFIENIFGRKMYEICNFLSGFFVVYAVIFNEKLTNLFSRQPCVYMGKVSFSVYLIHVPVISTLGVLVYSGFSNTFFTYNTSAFLACFIVVIIVFFLSNFFYRFVDLKAMSLTNSIANDITSCILMFKKKHNIADK